MPKRYLSEFKSQVVLSVQGGLSISEVIQQYKVAQSTLYRRIKEAKLSVGLPDPDYTTLQRKSQRLDHILQIIRLFFHY